MARASLTAKASDCFDSRVSVIRPVQLQPALLRQRNAFERAVPEALLDPALDLVQVDADRGQCLGVPAGRLALKRTA